jgi:hypothetical protein
MIASAKAILETGLFGLIHPLSCCARSGRWFEIYAREEPLVWWQCWRDESSNTEGIGEMNLALPIV